ncbi:MAG: class II aldolase/adducin family protein [Anaerolineae bacterium]|nr:class II aldolase/adducin family protein [Anaerolineae bacterium]
MFDRLSKASRDVVNLVSTQSRVDAKTRDILIPRPTRKILVETARLVFEENLSAGFLSELSMRLSGGKMAINALNTSFATLSEGDFAILNLNNGKTVTSVIPSRRVGWHCLAYNLTNANFAILCQPVASMIMAHKMALPDFALFEDAEEAIDRITCSTPDDDTLRKLIPENHAILIRGCGLFVWGETPQSTLARAALVNRLCEISIAAY